jgi:hypothetical protein
MHYYLRNMFSLIFIGINITYDVSIVVEFKVMNLYYYIKTIYISVNNIVLYLYYFTLYLKSLLSSL